ncbi:MAG TPA: transposase [Herpetosiphonaceae bacterium]
MRKNYTAAFKAQIVQAVLKEEQTVAQLAAEYQVHPNQIYRWREIAIAGLPSLFADQTAQLQAAQAAAHEREVQALYAEIGKLTTQLNWLKKKLPS